MHETDIIGIDLGTSNTVVAAFENGAPTTLADAEGNVLIPSVVAMQADGTVLVGYPAKERRFVDPKNTVVLAKRLVGRTWDDPDLQEARRRLPFELRQGKNKAVRVVLQDEFYALPEVSAFILRKARAVAEEALGRVVDRAVITVPANFNDLQRQATKLAGRLAGLDVVQVLNEPTAAAVAYGYGTDASERVAVYDFGGGTFDVTLLTLFEDVFRVRATGGDMFLGGDDIDLAVANVIADEIRRRHYFDPRTNPIVFDRVRDAAERLKFMLSSNDEAEVSIEGIVQSFGGREMRFVYGLDREQLDAIAEPIVMRTIQVCRDVFARSKTNVRQLDKVVLVGGSTRMRLVRERVADFFGMEPDVRVNPDEAVALGAAIQGLALKDTPRIETSNDFAMDVDLFDLQRLPTVPPAAIDAREPVRVQAQGLRQGHAQAHTHAPVDDSPKGYAFMVAQSEARRAPTARPPQAPRRNGWIWFLLAMVVVASAGIAAFTLWPR